MEEANVPAFARGVSEKFVAVAEEKPVDDAAAATDIDWDVRNTSTKRLAGVKQPLVPFVAHVHAGTELELD